MTDKEKMELEEEKNGCGCNGHHDEDHECGCGDNGCGCEEDEYEKMNIELDDGTSLSCFVLGVFGVEDKEYIALLPEGEENVLLYGYEEDGEEIELLNIEDDSEFEMVSEVFETLFMDEEDYEEEE
ncbi:hypothetical protein EUAN_13290 [Andreesenia angusta]|uniref:DUF1292 domain-containing protein n=1 Tax=Andreesenia angusta TaxID=39480 RepID=A0A1S1V948_9FIRM|nr:DUF1292 domain-containing protein [Andreesenia angusta]OHW62259.1 hypothetical protein EUAN_13290 [Andreesenia angusta]